MATSDTTPARGVIALPGEGKVYKALGTTTTLKVSSADAGGSFAVIEAVFPPQGGIPDHRHRLSDEAVYVLEGELVIRIGDRTVTAPAGSFGFIPKEVVHAMHNPGSQDCRALLWQHPGSGMAQQLEEMNHLPPGPPDMSQLLPILERFDIVVEAPPH